MGNNKELLDKLRKDIALHALLIHGKLGTTRFNFVLTLALLDFAYVIRTVIYSTIEEFFAPMRNFLLFSELEEKDNKSRIHLTALTILVISKECIDKTVITPSLGAWVKERDILPV